MPRGMLLCPVHRRTVAVLAAAQKALVLYVLFGFFLF
jgi:hypothetical protein